jgi:hypothetical protein
MGGSSWCRCMCGEISIVLGRLLFGGNVEVNFGNQCVRSVHCELDFGYQTQHFALGLLKPTANIILNYTCVRRPSSNRAVNTISLGYKNQAVSAVQRNKLRFCWDPYKTHKYVMWTESRIFELNLVVRKVTTRFSSVKFYGPPQTFPDSTFRPTQLLQCVQEVHRTWRFIVVFRTLLLYSTSNHVNPHFPTLFS